MHLGWHVLGQKFFFPSLALPWMVPDINLLEVITNSVKFLK